MSNTAGLNIANLQVYAEAAAAIDQANGTFSANQESNSHYYIWQSDFQTIPMGMNGNPEQFVSQMIQALPGVNCIRIPFNRNSFNSDGTLDPAFERFLTSVASHGLQIIPVLADGDAQEFNGTSVEIAAALGGNTFDGVLEGWHLMMAWMQAHPDVNSAVYGWELLNEPAAYKQAVSQADPKDRPEVQVKMVEMYVNHMAALAENVSSYSDARILVSAWGYGADTQTLSNTLISGISAVDHLRAAVGADLVWSLHYYPGWMATGDIVDPIKLQVEWANLMAPLAGDDILMTEINAPGSTTYNPFQGNQVTTATALSLEWLKEEGVGIGWFPALQTGSSGLALIEADGDIRYLNQPSLAAALNAFSYEESAPGHDHAELVRPVMIEAVLRNQVGDADYGIHRRDDVDFAGIGFGHGGNDTIIGSDHANNFLYGGAGIDRIVGGKNDDFLFGQNGNDFILSGSGIDYVFGGSGNDTIIADHEENTLYGGEGADVFVLEGRSKATIVDYSVAQRDSWMGPQNARYSGYKIHDTNIDGVSDMSVSFNDGSEVLFLGVGSHAGAISILSGLTQYANSIKMTLESLTDLTLSSSQVQFLNFEPQLSVIKANGQLVGGSNADYISGSKNGDTISGGNGSDTIYGGGNSDVLHGNNGKDLIFGGSGGDTLLGGPGADSLFGGAGHDSVDGGFGSDLISGGSGNDSLNGGYGNDVMSGEDGRDLITGGVGNDLVFAGSGADWVDGGEGNDTISGGSDRDTMKGGAGSDVFVFEDLPSLEDVDRILDFETYCDSIFLNYSVFGKPSIAALSGDFFAANVGGVAVSSSDRVIYDTATGKVYYDSDGSGSGERILFAILNHSLNLTMENFLFGSETQF